jgi:hypothetical protein
MFHALRKPHCKGTGDFEGQWHVTTLYEIPSPYTGFCPMLDRFGCLNVNGVVEQVDRNDYGKYYFQTELEAHAAASRYYEQFSKIYPYHDEWREAVMRAVSQYQESRVESEVMKF